MSSVVTLAVSGPAPCTYANTEALLNNWLGLGDKDGNGHFMLLDGTDPELRINVIVPVTDTRYTQGVESVLNWTGPAMARSIALADNKPTRADVELAHARCSQPVVVDDVDEALLAILNEHRRVGAAVLLVCLDPENPDPDVVLLMLQAQIEGIPIFNLALGMAPVDAFDYGGVMDVPMDDDEAPEEEPAAPEQPEQLDAFDAVAQAEVKPPVKTQRWFRDPETGELRKAGRGRPRSKVEYFDLPVEN